jgi:Na+-transporting methylmalonyl-CoA/oxaloacetate decarboxylase gamma subunit
MRITVMGVLLVVGGLVLLVLVVNWLGHGLNETGKSNEQPNRPS